MPTDQSTILRITNWQNVSQGTIMWWWSQTNAHVWQNCL